MTPVPEEIKKHDAKFFKYTIIASLVTIVIAVYPVTQYASAVQLYSFVSGYLISLLNALLGYKLNTMAFNKSVKSFMVLVFGGMGIRLMMVSIILLILLQFTQLEAMSLVGSVFFFYVLFITIEIYFLHTKQTLINKLAAAKKENETS
jgi:hypothetical protein